MVKIVVKQRDQNSFFRIFLTVYRIRCVKSASYSRAISRCETYKLKTRDRILKIIIYLYMHGKSNLTFIPLIIIINV